MENNELTLEQVADIIGNKEKDELSDRITKLYSAITNSRTKEDRPTIPEAIFKAVFADHIFGIYKSSNDINDLDYENSPIHAMWATVTGGPYTEVDVVDNNNNVLYTIPSILSRSELSVNIDIDGLGIRVARENDRSPVIGNTILNSALPTIANAVTPTEDIDSINFKWVNAFKKCYREELANAAQNNNTNSGINTTTQPYVVVDDIELE
jgi:hypothetical protein